LGLLGVVKAIWFKSFDCQGNISLFCKEAGGQVPLRWRYLQFFESESLLGVRHGKAARNAAMVLQLELAWCPRNFSGFIRSSSFKQDFLNPQ